MVHNFLVVESERGNLFSLKELVRPPCLFIFFSIPPILHGLVFVVIGQGSDLVCWLDSRSREPSSIDLAGFVIGDAYSRAPVRGP